MNAVKVAKNLSPQEIPSNLILGGIAVAAGSFANSFATHFHNKVAANTAQAKVKGDTKSTPC